MVLEAVHEQDFMSCSYGFRPGRSAHQALQQLSGAIVVRQQYWVLDVDIRKYFASIPHSHLRAILDRRQLARLSAKLVGHYATYGITGNSPRLQQYRHEVTKTWRKWLARRTRSKRLPWDRFNAFLARHPLPLARIVHRYA